VSAAYLTRHSAGDRLGRHRHAEGYVALVLAGGYVEAGDQGRIRVNAGHVVVHGAHEAHQDCFARRGAVVVNLPVPAGLPMGVGRIADPDRVARLAERDAEVAAAELAAQFRPGDAWLDDWPDRLARALTADTGIVLAEWADAIGMAPQSLSRGFARAYGTTPKRFRLEQRARRAAAMLPEWQDSLAMLAAETGFADQAHLARAVRSVTGVAPHMLRVQSVQA
jgi:AraC-like DNA-binding protein